MGSAGCTPSKPEVLPEKPVIVKDAGANPNGTGGAPMLSGVGVDARVFDPGEGGLATSRLQRSKVDLLVMLDDSSSMDEKHALLKAAVPDLVRRLVNPVCMAITGGTMQPASPSEPCPSGMERQYKPVQDLHIGVITSSIGAYSLPPPPPDADGSVRVVHTSLCDSPTGPIADRAHLFPTLPRGSAIQTYDGRGFFKWDPAQKATPPGEKDVERLVQSFTTLVDQVGEKGCGYEASLESWYRFLVDPDPPLTIVRPDSCPSGSPWCSYPSGLDTELLSQRAAFLRPDSLVVIVMLTDEDDCSMLEDQYGIQDSGRAQMMGSTVCRTAPDDHCCYPCWQPPPDGCAPDPACAAPVPAQYDQPNLACFDTKRRFGLDPLFPTKRYIDGLTARRIAKRDGTFVDNPLFGNGARTKDDVFLIGITGVPWQDVATPDTLKDPRLLRLKSSKDLLGGTWDVILGEGKQPGDPLMQGSMTPRTGVNPITLDPVASPQSSLLANPINGHEWLPISGSDLQFSCLFPLPAAQDCTGTNACGCRNQPDGTLDPTCQATDGTYQKTQRFGRAYPAPRILTVLKGLGESAVVASICPRNVDDSTREDYGYRPVIGAAILDVAPHIVR